MDSRSALRRRAREHEPANQPRPDERNLLRDKAAEREVQQVHLLELEPLYEAHGIAGHVVDVVGNDAGGAAHATVVEQDDLAAGSERIDQGGSQLSRFPRKCWRQTSGAAPLPLMPKRR
jgi:hypothetical protein